MSTLLLSVFFTVSASAYDVEVDGIYYDLISKGNVAIVTSGDKKYSGDINIPSSIKVNDLEYPVKVIKESAFSGCSGLTSVTIPNSVTSIGEYAFSGCYGLTSVTIPNSVTSIGEETFSYCRDLTSVTIPNSVTSIGCSAFRECIGLTSVTIPNSVTSIREYTFYKCSSLTSVTIPNSVTSIGESAFSYCSGLTSITIPNSVTSIGEWAFTSCYGLTSVTIPNSVTSIGYSAFRECIGLTSVTIPNSVTSIREYAFYGCIGLTSVTIPKSVTKISDKAFAKCSNLENVYCYAEKISYISYKIFEYSYIEFATLHVPSSALSYYQTNAPWSKFGTIKALEGADVETKKCDTPTISFIDGKLTFSCATEGVEYVSEVSCSDVNKYYSNEIKLAACYDITCYAKAEGFENSDVATAKLYWLTSSGSLETNINTAETRGVMASSANGFVTLSGLNTDEQLSFYATDGRELGTVKAIDGTAHFAAQSGTVVIAKIGKESIKIAVK